jgi:hypothetical protein
MQIGLIQLHGAFQIDEVILRVPKNSFTNCPLGEIVIPNNI